MLVVVFFFFFTGEWGESHRCVDICNALYLYISESVCVGGGWVGGEARPEGAFASGLGPEI